MRRWEQPGETLGRCEEIRQPRKTRSAWKDGSSMERCEGEVIKDLLILIVNLK